MLCLSHFQWIDFKSMMISITWLGHYKVFLDVYIFAHKYACSDAYAAHNNGNDVIVALQFTDYCESVKDVMVTHLHVRCIVQLWSMPTHSKLCKSNSVPSCSIVVFYVWVSAYNEASWPSSRNASSKWLLDIKSYYFQQRDTVRFLRQCLYSLSWCLPCWLRLKNRQLK